MARARGEDTEMYNATGQTTPLPRAASTQYFSLGDDEDVLAARPLALDEPRPRVRVLRRTVEQFGDVVPLVPALAVSAPQMVDQLVAVLARFDTPIADQVIEVPKVSCPLRCGRTVLCTPQTAEQLVTVPTILYFLKQTVGTRGRSGGPQGFLPEQRRPSTVEQIVDIPAPGRGVQRGLQGFSQERSSTAFDGAEHRFPAATAEQNVDIPVPGGLSVSGSSSSSAVLRDVRGDGVFRTFPQTKKVRQYLRTRGRNCLRTRAHGRRLLMTSPWCSRRRRRRRSPRTSLTFTSSTWSMMGAGGGASGSQLTSSTAGGWPLPMGPRLAILSGGLHGSSAAVQGDDATKVLLGWCLVRQWIHVPASSYCGGAYFSSSSKWWISSSLQRQVRTVSNCAKSSTTLSWRRGRFSGPVQQTTEISKLQSIDTVVVVVVQVLQFGYTPCGDSRDPTVAARFSGPCRSHAHCVQRQMPMVDVLVQFIDGSHVPVITQRRLLSGSAPDSVIAGDSGHSSCATEMGT